MRYYVPGSSSMARDNTMKTVIFLNKWSNLYHLMLASVGDDGENSRRLDSRYATSLEQARKAVAYWITEFNVTAERGWRQIPLRTGPERLADGGCDFSSRWAL